jgi:hypothetical protein
LAQNLCDVVRIKLQCRGPLHLPANFFFEVKKKYYPISIKVEAIGERPDVSTDNREDDPNNGKYIED